MAQYESNVKHVPYSQERVYDKLSDLNNLAAIRERMDEMLSAASSTLSSFSGMTTSAQQLLDTTGSFLKETQER